MTSVFHLLPNLHQLWSSLNKCTEEIYELPPRNIIMFLWLPSIHSLVQFVGPHQGTFHGIYSHLQEFSQGTSGFGPYMCLNHLSKQSSGVARCLRKYKQSTIQLLENTSGGIHCFHKANKIDLLTRFCLSNGLDVSILPEFMLDVHAPR